jgi:hypothetical protein
MMTNRSEPHARAPIAQMWFGVFAVAGLIGTVSAAKGAPPANADPSLAPWFESLQRPDGSGSCCSTADCRRVQSRRGGKSYEVQLDGTWVAVPQDRVLRRENPTGDAIACTRSHVILCFVPAPET